MTTGVSGREFRMYSTSVNNVSNDSSVSLCSDNKAKRIHGSYHPLPNANMWLARGGLNCNERHADIVVYVTHFDSIQLRKVAVPSRTNKICAVITVHKVCTLPRREANLLKALINESTVKACATSK